MSRNRHPLRSLAFTLGVAALVGGLLLAGVRPGFTNDVQLLRRGSATPFVFLLLDTSGSMNLGLNDAWLPGGADNPSSRLFLARRALAEVFGALGDEDISVGLAGYNHDKLRVVAKHWLYYNAQALPAAWPISFPAADTDGLTTMVDTITVDSNGDGLADAKDGIPDSLLSDVEGHVMTFGPPFAVQANVPALRQAGSCAAPLDLDTVAGLRRAQTFAIEPGNATPSTLWVSQQNKKYRLTVRTDPDAQLGNDNFKVQLTLQPVNSLCVDNGSASSLALSLRLDPNLSQHLAYDSTSGREVLAGLWNVADVVETTDYLTERPHTGYGWEGNYDSNHDGSLNGITGSTNEDRYCAGATCIPYKPLRQTQLAADRVLDRGDLLPFDWNNTNLNEFLRRMSPTSGRYGVAGYFRDTAASGLLAPTDDDRVPLMAAGLSPLNKSINDFRCYYLGEGNKCTSTPFFSVGWDALACQKDKTYGCRRPYLIVISDGEENTNGSDATSEVANMNSKAGVQTWVLNLGNESRCKGGGSLNSLTQAGNGRCITISNPTELKAKLLEILGIIEQRARSFASAAVPSVQVTVQDKIFVTNFTPVQGVAHWAGRVHAFLKPIPVAADGKPDIERVCQPRATPDAPPPSTCHLWDAGTTVLGQAPDFTTASSGDLRIGIAENQRRIYYSRLPSPVDTTADTWVENLRQLRGTASVSGAEKPVAYDLWRAFGLTPADTADGTLPSGQETSNQDAVRAILARALSKKSATIDDGSTIEYVLGDIFHSNPVIVGAPANVQYFAQDLNLYREFAEKHQNRRKMLLFGTNDGMLHAIDAGQFFPREQARKDLLTQEPLLDSFDNGSGKEIFAYVPRGAMPAVREMTIGGGPHKFTVDGSVNVADVFIDPRLDLGVANAAERHWRTVVIGGFREGGQGYYALDITQPDELTTRGSDDLVHPKYSSTTSRVPSCMTADEEPEPGADPDPTPDPDPDPDSELDCGPLPFPAALWEFNDSLYNGVKKVWKELDEDDNGVGDLGDTWSTPNMGRIRLCTDAACSGTIDKYVAVFGGGMDTGSKSNPANAVEGNWLYMVDIETGKAIYKRQLVGAAPSEPAAVDTDQDGYLDRIYQGTIAGLLYRVDLTADASGKLPALGVQIVKDVDGTTHSVERIPAASWVPRVLFDANYDGSTPLAARSMARSLFYRPSILFVAKLGLYALAFGTGDREDLWAAYNGVLPRFYVFVDDSENPSVTLPLVEGNFPAIEITGGNAAAGTDYLLAAGISPGHRGWVLKFNEEDRLITDPFSLAGVTIFSTYRPRVQVTDGTSSNPETVVCSDKKEAADTNNTCSLRGNSRLFVMSTINGDTYQRDILSRLVRYRELNFFVTNPFAEQGLTRNTVTNEDADNDGVPDNQLTPNQEAIMSSLKALFPKSCRFSNQRIDIKTITDETEVELIAPIPVCTIQKNWKEF